MSNCSHVSTPRPATDTMRSPGRMSAFAAADSVGDDADHDRLILVTSTCSTPWYSTTAVRTSASRRFITGPMIRTWNRSHFVFDRNSSGA